MSEHRRIVYPAPSGHHWRIACTCGWEGHVELADMPHNSDVDDVLNAVDRLFINHLPADGLRSYVKVDRRAGFEGAWVMPIGVPVNIMHWWENDGTYWASTAGAIEGEFPVGEILTVDGQIFRLDDIGAKLR